MEEEQSKLSEQVIAKGCVKTQSFGFIELFCVKPLLKH